MPEDERFRQPDEPDGHLHEGPVEDRSGEDRAASDEQDPVQEPGPDEEPGLDEEPGPDEEAGAGEQDGAEAAGTADVPPEGTIAEEDLATALHPIVADQPPAETEASETIVDDGEPEVSETTVHDEEPEVSETTVHDEDPMPEGAAPGSERSGLPEALEADAPEEAVSEEAVSEQGVSEQGVSEAAMPEADTTTVTSAVGAAAAAPRHVRTFREWMRPDLRQSVIAILLALFSFAVITQVRTRDQVDSYSSLRQSDLVGMLDGLNQESQRLQSELEGLQQARDQLRSGQDNEALARAQAEQRLTSLGILAGTIPTQGPGITLTISDPQGKVKASMILDAVEEMRDAGAESIQFNGKVRVVASSWFGSGTSGIVVDGQAVSTPITMDVIGDPHALEEAARFRGGLVSQITDPRVGGAVNITRSDQLNITSVHQVTSPRFARPDQTTGASASRSGG